MGSVLRIQPLDGAWQTLGVDRLRGLTPENIEASSDEGGSTALSFSLKAHPGVDRPDLLPFTPIEFEDEGILGWSGFIWERPRAENAYTVSCRGWQYHLDDDLLSRVYVHTRVSDYQDVRSIATADLTKWDVGGAVTSDGVASFGKAADTLWANDQAQGVTLDLGPDSVAKRIVVEWDSQNLNGNTTFDFYARAHTLPGNAVPGGTYDDAIVIDFGASPGTSGTSAGTFATARRYVTLFLYWTGAGGTTGSDHLFRVKSVQVFSDTAYESGNASILKADQVIKDVLELAPLLNQSTAMIAAGTFSIPEYVTNDYEPPRAVMEAVNAYERMQLKVDVEKRLVYRAKPSAPLFEVKAGFRFADAGASGEDIFDQVIVKGQGADGSFLGRTRSQTGTLVDRRGFHRTRVLEARRGLGTTEANRLGDLWLAEHRTTPFSGTLDVGGDLVTQVLGGASVPPAAMLLHTGEKIRLPAVDPDTGAFGRDGRIAAVKYRPAGKSLEISIDDKRDSFETVLARYLSLPS